MSSLSSEQRSPLDQLFLENTRNRLLQELNKQEVCSQNEDVPLAFYSGVGVDLKDVEPSKIARYIRSEEVDISHFLPPLNKGNNKNGLRQSPTILRAPKQDNNNSRIERSNSFLSSLISFQKESPVKLSSNVNQLRRRIGLPVDQTRTDRSKSNSSEIFRRSNNNNSQFVFSNQSMMLDALEAQQKQEAKNKLQYELENLDKEDDDTLDQGFQKYHQNHKQQLMDSLPQTVRAPNKSSKSPKSKKKMISKYTTKRLDNHFPFSPQDENDPNKQIVKQKHLPNLNPKTKPNIYDNSTCLRYANQFKLKILPPKQVLNPTNPSENLKYNNYHPLKPPIDHPVIKISPKKKELNSKILQEIQQLEVSFEDQEKENELLLRASQKYCVRDFQEACMFRALQPDIPRQPLPVAKDPFQQEKRSSSAGLKKPYEKNFLFSGTGLKERQEIKAILNSLESYSNLIKERTDRMRSMHLY